MTCGSLLRRTVWACAVLTASVGCSGGNPALATPAPQQSQAPPTVVNLTLTGTVSDARTSTAIAGATVSIVEGTNARKTTKTNSRGEYRFENLETGNATLSATAGGYNESRLEVLIDGTTTLNFTLTSSRQSPK